MTALPPILVGQETEYAVTAFAADGAAIDRASILERLLKLARRRLVHLRGGGAYDIYLRNGARLYIDSGLHPEWSTPECTSPNEVLAHARGGDSTLFRLAAAVQSEDPNISDIVITKCNVDYADRHATWGCHESYLNRCSRRELAKHLIPHLVSRVIYAGAGGLDPMSPGIAFTLSPRVAHLKAVVSDSSTSNRGILHTKKEPLCGMGYDRLHLICGESLCSQTADYLRWGTTALIVRLIEAGRAPASEVQLAEPLTAMRMFSADPDCRVEAALTDGGNTTAIRIQRHFLQHIERVLAAPYSPSWATQVCERWREVLDQLEKDPAKATTLDWVVKQALFQRQAAKRDFDWAALPSLTSAVSRIDRLFRAPAILFDDDDREASSLRHGWLPARWTEDPKIQGELDQLELSSDVLDRFLCLRHELAEIDFRYGQIGPKGIFASLAASGWFDSELVSSENIDAAAHQPPQATRARIRGEWIGRLTNIDGAYDCGWDRIIDFEKNRVLELSDPLQQEAAWTNMPADERILGRRR